MKAWSLIILCSCCICLKFFIKRFLKLFNKSKSVAGKVPEQWCAGGTGEHPVTPGLPAYGHAGSSWLLSIL